MTLADALSSEPISRVAPTPRGPAPACNVYGKGDLKTFVVLLERRDAGEIWGAQQALVDKKLGIETRIKGDKFRYHWSGKCGHWDHLRDELDALHEKRKDAAA